MMATHKIEAWICRENIAHYDRLLRTNSDERQCETLRRLKAETETKLAGMNALSAVEARLGPKDQ
jgi:hypothetical protein